MSLRCVADDDGIAVTLTCDGVAPQALIPIVHEQLTLRGTWYPTLHSEACRRGWKFQPGGAILGPCCSGKR